MLILVPSLILTLFFSSMVAFVCSRFSWRFNILLLSLFTAGNLLPQQIIIQPLFQFYNRVELPELALELGQAQWQHLGIILIHVAFQSGFCTFVLSNYMKLLPKSLNEAARIDGAGVWKQYWQIIMPLTLPAIAALATLEFTWIYNDFFWAVVLEQQGADRPITSSLANLGGEFFTDDNLIAAASMYVALPTLIVYFALQRYFIAGLTIGAEKVNGNRTAAREESRAAVSLLAGGSRFGRSLSEGAKELLRRHDRSTWRFGHHPGGHHRPRTGLSGRRAIGIQRFDGVLAGEAVSIGAHFHRRAHHISAGVVAGLIPAVWIDVGGRSSGRRPDSKYRFASLHIDQRAIRCQCDVLGHVGIRGLIVVHQPCAHQWMPLCRDILSADICMGWADRHEPGEGEEGGERDRRECIEERFMMPVRQPMTTPAAQRGRKFGGLASHSTTYNRAHILSTPSGKFRGHCSSASHCRGAVRKTSHPVPGGCHDSAISSQTQEKHWANA